MHFDVIPKAVDEYHQQLRAFAVQDKAKRMNNPVFHIHGQNVPTSDMLVPFSMLLNLASVSSAETKKVMWGFINKYAPEASPEKNPSLDDAAGFAVRFYHDFVKPSKKFRAPSDQERAALTDLAIALKDVDMAKAMIDKKNADMATGDPRVDELNLGDADDLQSIVFAVGKNHGFEPLRLWFTAIYEVLLGSSQGPRFGGFIALYGADKTVALIEAGLSGDLA